MRKNHFIIVFLFLNLLQLYAQSKSQKIKDIDKIVATTNRDSTIQKVVVEIKTDNETNAENSRQQITVF